MYVLVACEESGMVREAFRARGHDAYSCDLGDAKDGSPHHLKIDCREILDGFRIPGVMGWRLRPWDMMICHPPCTYLSVSSVWALKDADFERYPDVGYHMKLKPGTLTGAARRKAQAEAVDFVKLLMGCDIPKIGMENPVGNLSSLYRQPDQTIQPWLFGDDASKQTCLWLKGLPLLKPLPVEQRAKGRTVEWPKGSGKMVVRFENQTDGGQNRLPPSKGRAAARAVTYPGIAKAMAEQWGNL